MSGMRSQTAVQLPLETPRKVAMSSVETTGAHKMAYPTFTLSYFGAKQEDVPDPDHLLDFQAAAINFLAEETEETSTLELVFFLQPKKELMDFAHSKKLELEVNARVASNFLHKIDSARLFCVLINTDHYMYRGLFDNESGEIMEAQIDFRLVN